MDLLEKLSKHKFVDSALIVAFVTALSYFLTYVYEVSYMNYFDVGSESARVELEPLLITTVVLIVLTGMSILVLVRITNSYRSEKRGSLRYILKKLLFVTTFFLLAMLPIVYAADPANFTKQLFNQLLQLTFVILVISFVFGLVSLVKRLVVKKKDSIGVLVRKQRAITKGSFLYSMPVISLLLIFSYANFFGVSSAYNQHRFKLIEYKGSDYLVLREYRERFVAAKYNSRTNELTSDYIYISLSQPVPTEFKTIDRRPVYNSRYIESSSKNQTFIRAHSSTPYIEFSLPRL